MCRVILADMAPVVIWILVALLLAVVVLVVAGASGGSSSGLRVLLADLRSGLRRDHRAGMLSGLREEMAETADVTHGSVDDLFAIGEPEDHDYVTTDDLRETLGRVTGRSRELSRR